MCPIPNKNNQFYLFGRTTTNIITFNDDGIQQQQIDTQCFDVYVNSGPILLANGELIILGLYNILMFNMETNTSTTIWKKGRLEIG